MPVRDARCRIQLLGGLRVQQDAQSITRFRTQKTGALLAYLAYHVARSHPREALMALLWPEADLESGRNGLRVALSSLRRQLEPPGVVAGTILQADYLSVQLNPAAVRTDVADFEAALEAAARAGSSLERIQHLGDAVALYKGLLLPGFYEDWIVAEQQRLAVLFSQAIRQLAAHWEQAGDYEAALQYARRAVDADALDEAALSQYQRLEQLLKQGFDQAPFATTRSLLHQIEKTSPQGAEGHSDRLHPSLPAPASRRLSPEIEATPPTGIFTFLGIDMEGGAARPAGTAPSPREGGASSLRQQTLRRYGGRMIQEAGSASIVLFGRASDALACALALARQEPPVALRMALDTGEIKTKESQPPDAMFGRAYRLLAAGHTGQILCSESTAILLRQDLEPGLRLVDLGVYRLRDLPAPERLFQIDTPGLPEGHFPALPGHLAPDDRPGGGAGVRGDSFADSTRATGLAGAAAGVRERATVSRPRAGRQARLSGDGA